MTSIVPGWGSSSSATGRRSPGSRASSTPRVSAEYLNWREQLAKLPGAPDVCVTEVPLLYEVGAQNRFDKVVAITAPRLLREQRTNVPMGGREERLIPDREKVKRADYAYVNTGGLDQLDAWVGGVMEELRASRGRAPL